MRYLAPLLTALSLSCHQASPTSRATAALDGCVDPVTFGAVPDDGISDRDAFQRALDVVSAAGGTLCIGPGRWTMQRSRATRSARAGTSASICSSVGSTDRLPAMISLMSTHRHHAGLV